MNSERRQAIEYLRAPAGGLWRWSEYGAVLVWRDGGTIAFREEIVAILERLALHGLPPFGALVLLLAATRRRMPRLEDVFSDPPLPPSSAMRADPAALAAILRARVRAQVTAALSELAKVASLPAELTTGLPARCVLAEAVFEPAKADRRVSAGPVLQGLQVPFRQGELVDQVPDAGRADGLRQLHLVAAGLERHTAESLALRLRTGLDALPQDAGIARPAAERARRLIDELSRDPELGAVGRAARDLLAAIRLPRRLDERERLAVGGVADIANRGPLDRLLLSELAHDDLTLSARVALNEALYLRREPPRREPPSSLAILLDSGVRLWGAPRVLATAVALALIARDARGGRVRVWRARGGALAPVDLLSREGLVRHLGALETSAHPGEAVAALAAETASETGGQSVVITHHDTLADPEFRRLLARDAALPAFAAAVDRDGRFELHALPLAGRPPLCEARLDIARAFGAPAVAPIRADAAPDLPALFRVSPFPFLLPISGSVQIWTRGDDDFTYAVLKERRLVQYRHISHGGRVLATHLPGGRALWMECVDGTVHLVRAGARHRPVRLLSLPVSGGDPRVNELDHAPDVRAVHRCGDAILLIGSGDIRAFALGDGRPLGRAANRYEWVCGRFLRDRTRDRFLCAGWNGAGVTLDAVPLPANVRASDITLMFDREGLPGPWALTRAGVVVSTAGGDTVDFPVPAGRSLDFRSAEVSRDGHHLRVAARGAKSGALPPRRVFALPPHVPGSLGFSAPVLPAWNVYCAVEAVGVFGGALMFRGRKHGRLRRVVLDAGGRLRIVDPASSPSAEGKWLTFDPPMACAGVGCTLQRAQAPGGGAVFLDSRGLLHLRSGDPSVPELSLVLGVWDVAGWTSDGLTCGPPFFFDGPRESRPEVVFERLQRFLDAFQVSGYR